MNLNLGWTLYKPFYTKKNTWIFFIQVKPSKTYHQDPGLEEEPTAGTQQIWEDTVNQSARGAGRGTQSRLREDMN